jgi:hypothetical protein
MLSVTLVPGKTMQPAERVDNSKLNLLGSPTVEIEGAATTAQIEDDAVTLPKMEADPNNADSATLRAGGVFPIFDILTARPVFNCRRYAGANDQAKVQAAINAAIAEGGGCVLIDRDFTLDDMVAGVVFGGVYHFLYANVGPRVQLAFKAIRSARLLGGGSASSGNGVGLLGVYGLVEDLVVEGLNFERTATGGMDHVTVGLGIYDNNQGLKRARVFGCHYRNLSNPIVGAGVSVRIEDNDFTYPYGDPKLLQTTGGMKSYAVTLTPAYGNVVDVQLTKNRMDGGAIEAHPWTGYPAYGFCDVQAQGARIDDNDIRRVSDIGINVEARPIGSSNSWVSAPREIVVCRNKVEFDDVTGQTAPGTRLGIYSGDAGITVSQNRVRNCYSGIWVTGQGSGYDGGSDLTTRMRKAVIVDNDIEMAADLAMDDANAYVSGQARRGIEAAWLRRVKIADNTVEFAGRTSAAVTAKNWCVPGIMAVMVDDGQIGENSVFGPVDVNSAATDLIWLTGLQVESCRKLEVGKNYLRNLNIGVNAGPGGSGVVSSAVEFAEQRMEDVVWPYASLNAQTNDGSKTPATLMKRVTGNGIRMRKARTSFALDIATLGAGFAGGYVRVGSFLYGCMGRVRLWTEGPDPETHATVDVGYWNGGAAGNGAMVQTVFLAEGVAQFTKMRLCVNNAPGDRVAHLDVYVPAYTSSRIFVEVESPLMGYEGLWGAPGFAGEHAGGVHGGERDGVGRGGVDGGDWRSEARDV